MNFLMLLCVVANQLKTLEEYFNGVRLGQLYGRFIQLITPKQILMVLDWGSCMAVH